MDAIKHKITRYWSRRADSFQTQRLREFQDKKHARWLRELYRYIPDDRPLRILDIGTGTGFFAFILAAEGHETVGIDLTPAMIQKAKESADILGLNASFFLMDAEHPELEPESFDVLVTRNLTWTLPHLDRAYREWYRLLRPGGVLINFDADYCREQEEREEDAELPEDHAHKLLDPSLKAEHNEISMDLYAYQMPRPQWDVQLLIEAGFEKVMIDTGVYRRIYQEIDEFYNPVPIFTITAFKEPDKTADLQGSVRKGEK